MKKIKATDLKFLLDLLYPPRCVLCDEILGFRERGCCTACSRKLPWITGARCMKCGKPVAGEEVEYCSDCARQHHYFDAGTAPFTYSGALRDSIYRMKYENRRDYLDFYAEAMVRALQGRLKYWRPELIVSVPMHPSKKRKRGYNQAELLAKRISSLTGIAYERDALRCVRRTSSQKTLGRKERMQNLKGSFQAVRLLAGLGSVLVVDDVYTTGSTMDEISRTLKACGAQHVYFVVLCTGKGKKDSLHG